MAMSWAGTDLSQLARNTAASKGVAEAWISMRSQMVEREAREKLMPSWPWAMPSQMSVAKYRAARPPARATPLTASFASSSRWPEPGWLSPKVLSTNTWGLDRSSAVQPMPIRRGSISGESLRSSWLIIGHPPFL